MVLSRFISFRAKLRNFNWDDDILYSNHKNSAKEAESHFSNLLTESEDFSLKAPTEDFEMSRWQHVQRRLPAQNCSLKQFSIKMIAFLFLEWS